MVRPVSVTATPNRIGSSYPRLFTLCGDLVEARRQLGFKLVKVVDLGSGEIHVELFGERAGLLEPLLEANGETDIVLTKLAK
jgi:hypothetical protein